MAVGDVEVGEVVLAVALDYINVYGGEGYLQARGRTCTAAGLGF